MVPGWPSQTWYARRGRGGDNLEPNPGLNLGLLLNSNVQLLSTRALSITSLDTPCVQSEASAVCLLQFKTNGRISILNKSICSTLWSLIQDTLE